MKRLVILMMSVGLLTGLTGCSYLNVGEEEFSCTGMPDSVYCHSAREVYEATNTGEVPSPMGKDGAYNEECDDCQKSYLDDPERRAQMNAGGMTSSSYDGYAMGGGDEIINSYVSPRLPDRPVPIRTPAVVMRIWVAPWIDNNDDLNAPGFIYTEIEPRRWIYPEVTQRSRNSFSPLMKTKKTDRDGQKPKENSLNQSKEK